MRQMQGSKAGGWKNLATALVLILTLMAPVARAQSTEERFQDLFVTAGYATAFGAAFGTAVLFLNPETDPSTHLRYVAVGASLGFIGGSIMGSYLIFSPVFSSDGEARGLSGNLAGGERLPARRLVIRPTFGDSTHALKSLEGGIALAQF